MLGRSLIVQTMQRRQYVVDADVVDARVIASRTNASSTASAVNFLVAQ
jgi:hypothetical protein